MAKRVTAPLRRTELALLIALAVVMVGGMAMIGFVNGW